MTNNDREKMCDFLTEVGFANYDLVFKMKKTYTRKFPSYHLKNTKDYMNFCNSFYKEIIYYHKENDAFENFFNYIKNHTDGYENIIQIIKKEIKSD